MASGFPSTTWPDDDIIVQEGTFAYDFIASGTIYAGQAVEPVGTMQVRKVTTAYKGIGVAAYDAADTTHVAVYGPGNIVRACASGTSCAVSKPLFASIEGKWQPLLSTAWATVSGAIGIALDSQATADGSIRILLK